MLLDGLLERRNAKKNSCYECDAAKEKIRKDLMNFSIHFSEIKESIDDDNSISARLHVLE